MLLSKIVTKSCLCIYSLSGNVASDTTLLAKFENHHESHDCFERSRMGPTFTIVHYAGKVTYEIKVCINDVDKAD